MQGWIEAFQRSIDFMEQNLTETLDIEEIAGKAALSPFHYQRIFGALCGMTVGENAVGLEIEALFQFHLEPLQPVWRDREQFYGPAGQGRRKVEMRRDGFP